MERLGYKLKYKPMYMKIRRQAAIVHTDKGDMIFKKTISSFLRK